MKKDVKKSKFDLLIEQAFGEDADFSFDEGAQPTDEGTEGDFETDDLGGEDDSGQVTITLDKATAQTLIDVLQAAIGGGDEFGAEDEGLEGEGEGDEEFDIETADEDEEEESEDDAVMKESACAGKAVPLKKGITASTKGGKVKKSNMKVVKKKAASGNFKADDKMKPAPKPNFNKLKAGKQDGANASNTGKVAFEA